MGRSKHLFLVAASALALSACEATHTNHGFAPQIAQLEQLSSSDTRGSVLRQLGQPSATGTFNSENWYYQASRVENYAFYAPKIVDRKVVAIRFDQAGRVANVARYGIEEGQITDLITRTTPTYGREITLLQQLFGNIGRVGADQFFDGRLPGG